MESVGTCTEMAALKTKLRATWMAGDFGEDISKLDVRTQSITWVFPFSPAEIVEHFRMYYGPTQKAFGMLDESKQAALRHDLEPLWSSHNRATDGTTLVEAQYLEVIAVRE